MRILVTGGAGYIGSHTIKALGQQGHEIITYDNLSTGNGWAVLYGDLVEGDLGNLDLLRRTLRDFSPEAVMHFAGSIAVEESVKKPLLYYRNNVVNTLHLLKEIVRNKIPYFIYSSTAAVYGIPDQSPIDESTPLNPINPYGTSKMMAEKIVQDVSAQAGLQYVILRYFNVAGADPDGHIGQAYKNNTHLITRALKAARGEFSKLLVYGTDYNTPDGTCVRDYVHVTDLAEAHICALKYLSDTADHANHGTIMNCGYGRGFSVREVIKMARDITGVDFVEEEQPRRPGDAPFIISDPQKLKIMTGWKPKYDNLEVMIRSAWEWEKKHESVHNKSNLNLGKALPYDGLRVKNNVMMHATQKLTGIRDI